MSYRELYNIVIDKDVDVLKKFMIFERFVEMWIGFEWLDDVIQDQIVEKFYVVYVQFVNKVKFDDFLYVVYELVDEDLKRRFKKIFKFLQKRILDKVELVLCIV